jgi:hypothetical protein
MDSRILRASGLAFANHVENTFEAASLLPGADNYFTAPRLEVPYVGGATFVAGHEPRSLRHLVFGALCAKAQFEREAPSWAPPLPLRKEACAILANSADPKMNAVGLFAQSLRYAGWSEDHPSFGTYVCGLMACRGTPKRIRHDVDLRLEFIPRRLAGLCAETLRWRSPKKLAFDRLSATSHVGDYLA